jgi:hypothetical protein
MLLGEEGRADLMKTIFLLAFVYRHGLSELPFYMTTKASNKKEAERRGIKYASTFWQQDTIPDEEKATRFWMEEYVEGIEFHWVKQVTAKQVVDALSIDDWLEE